LCEISKLFFPLYHGVYEAPPTQQRPYMYGYRITQELFAKIY